ncbi:MAG: stage II sporulation protein R [Bacilli bacterium]|nr:stage II sporulation protein R [Bacilli bacterium]
MKKTIMLIGLIIGIYIFIGYKFSDIEIPNEALRIRILANSNSDYDQQIKNSVKTEIQDYVYDLLKDTTDIEEARKIINSKLDNISSLTNMFLKKQNYNLPYSVNFGYNYFPKKVYKGITYDAGYYESLLITLGSGNGDNWWCVLFPPLCLLEAEESVDVEYTTLVSELLKRYKK